MNSSLKFDSSTPLYLQLEESIRTDICSGELPAGSRIPTEFELADTYHVSRVTVRKALAKLEKEGYVERKTGKGTYVKEQKLLRNLSGNVLSFTRMCAELGMKASSQTLTAGLQAPGEVESRRLKLAVHEQAVIIERIRFADGQAVMLEEDLFPSDMTFLTEEDLDSNSIYELICRRKGITFTRSSRTIDIVFAQAREARLLGIKTGYPLLRIQSVTQDPSGEITTLSTQLYIGDRFQLRV